ncbi:MAG: homoserine O-succinyltransferase [Xanthobacter sp.]
MPIKIPDDLPARAALEAEGVMIMGEADAIRQDIRPLRFGLLNLMPNKTRTETQIARLLGATPLQIELSLIRMTHHVSRHTSPDHMEAFYRPWEDVRREKYDGFIITGAPVEKLPYEAVTYWDELCAIFDWTQSNVHRCLNICWAAQASLRHFHGVPKHMMATKMFGVFPHRNLSPTSPYLRGFSDDFAIPVSRWTEVRADDLPANAGLKVLMDSPQAGLGLVEDGPHRSLNMFSHVEYDSDTLGEEYRRDVAAGGDILMPYGYFPEDDPRQAPRNHWRGHAHLLFGNWINEIYQTTPYDITRIGA